MKITAPPDRALAATLSGKLRRGELLSSDCPSRTVLKHVTGQWGVLVLIVLRDGTHRFSELRRKVNGISEKMLAQTLQALEGDGFVLRQAFAVVPPHVEYSLTDVGEEIALRVAALADWIELNMGRLTFPRDDQAPDDHAHVGTADHAAVSKEA